MEHHIDKKTNTYYILNDVGDELLRISLINDADKNSIVLKTDNLLYVGEISALKLTKK